jgi:alkaline phosphatase D
VSVHTRFVIALGTAAAALLFAIQGAPSAQVPAPLVLTHGIASGDVTSSTAVIWARASGKAQMHVDVDTDPALSRPRSSKSAAASEAADFTAQLTLEGLKSDTRYYYRVWLSGAGGRGRSRVSESPIGTFKTAPDPWQSRPVSFIVGADVGGQRYCRNVAQGGYRIFEKMERLNPDFYIANGDSIYADADCPVQGGEPGWVNIPGDFPSIADPLVDWTQVDTVREIYLRHWRYNRADPFTQSFFQSTSMIAQWDDHEVINDFGAQWTYWNSATAPGTPGYRPGYPNLVAAGLDTFFAYSPIDRDRADRDRIYRSFRWGKDVELFVLDARSYRERNDTLDTAAEFKPMLGREQIAWLVNGIEQSTATWKIVSSDVPISIPTGSLAFGRDAWARLPGEPPTGFRRELLFLLSELDRINAENLVFVATDVHYATNLAYAFDGDGDGDALTFHEFVRGPLNAVKNPARTKAQLDPSANPTVLYTEGGFFNFGYFSIRKQADGRVHLIADARGDDGQARPLSIVDLTPAN